MLLNYYGGIFQRKPLIEIAVGKNDSLPKWRIFLSGFCLIVAAVLICSIPIVIYKFDLALSFAGIAGLVLLIVILFLFIAITLLGFERKLGLFLKSLRKLKK